MAWGMSKKTPKALISGITGQDGAYLAALLLQKGYKVYGAKRRSSNKNTWRLEELGIADKVEIVDMELTEFSNILQVIGELLPDELYNLAGQSYVATSFIQPIFTGDVNSLGVTRLLEACRLVSPETRFYQASSSEMFGKVQSPVQSESTPFYPRSPYGVSKLYGHWITVNYRESYGMHACSGILFNHESPLRGAEFVTRKIAIGLTNIHQGSQEIVTLGNLDAKRDWGFAGDYVTGMWQMLQHEHADDYVLATGKTHSIREFVDLAAQYLGMNIVWEGEGEKSIGIDRVRNKTIVAVNKKYFRPTEVDYLVGDASKARRELGWVSPINFPELIELMMETEMKRSGAKHLVANN